MGAIQTLFRTLQLYGTALSLKTWSECVWKVTFPLLDTLLPHVRPNALMPPSSPDAAGTTVFDADMPTQDLSSSWDDSKVVALQSNGAILSDFLASKIMHLPRGRPLSRLYATRSCSTAAPSARLRCAVSNARSGRPRRSLKLALCHLRRRPPPSGLRWWRCGKGRGSSARRWVWSW
jgi:hypothetical protein